MVYNTHEWIKKLISPVVKECSFLVDDPKMFKKRLLADSKKNGNIHEIIVFDAKRLFTSINTYKYHH